MLYVTKKEHVEHARLRALAQAIINKEKGKEVFDDYMKAAYPWIEADKSRQTRDYTRVLLEEVKKGGLGIRPLWQQPKMRSHLKTKVIERTKTREEMDTFYKKLKPVPL